MVVSPKYEPLFRSQCKLWRIPPPDSVKFVIKVMPEYLILLKPGSVIEFLSYSSANGAQCVAVTFQTENVPNKTDR